MAELEKDGFERRTSHSIRYPKPRIALNELTPSEIEEALRKLPEWQLTTSEIPGKEPMTRIEFKRVYEFRSFVSAIAYMNEASRHISEVEHHPRWENMWRTVAVWLTTWDIGSRPSRLDIELAQYLDELFATYRRPKKKLEET